MKTKTNIKPEDIKKFLDDKNLKYYETDTHFQVDCFLCGDIRKRLGISKSLSSKKDEDYRWQCFNCNSNAKKFSSLKYSFDHKANIKTKHDVVKDEQEEKCTIKSDFHKPFVEYLNNTERYKTFDYLVSERKLSKKTIDFFELGARKTFVSSSGNKYKPGEHLAIPYIKDGKCVNIKYRALDPETPKENKWRREKGGVSSLFNDQALDNLDYSCIFITEAEIDCMSLWEIGVKNVVGLTVGAKGFKAAWYERLRRFEKIYLVLDRDQAGQEGAEKLAHRLGMGRCYNIILPEDVKDPNDFIKKYGLEDFNKLADKATQFQVKGVVSAGSSLKQIILDKERGEVEDKGYTTRWPKLNKVMGTMKPGNLVILSAPPKIGKTSFCLDMCADFADQGIPVGMYSCEMQHKALTEKLMARDLYTGFHQGLWSVEDMDDIDLSHLRFKMYNVLNNFYMYYPEMGDLELDKVVARITEMVQRYDLKFFVFDNLHLLCRGDDEKALIDKATQAFKILAENLQIVFILIVQPRKVANQNKAITTSDLKGSSSIYQDADLVILMHRRVNDGDMLPDEIEAGVSEGSKSPRTEFNITGRYVEGGKTYLAFNGARNTFLDKGTLYNNCMKDLIGKKKKKGF